MGAYPQIAYLIPVRDDQAGLDISLDSLGRTRGPRPAVVVVDDGSAAPVQLPTGSDLRLELIRLAENQGIARALNAGLDLVLQHGFKYVARLDAGDVCRPNRSVAQIECLELNPDVAIVGSYAMVTDSAGTGMYRVEAPQETARLRRAMRLNNVIPHATLMLRTDALRDVGSYSYDYPAAEDYELLLRIMQRYPVMVLGEVLVELKTRPQGISLSRRRQQILSRFRIQLKYFDARYPESYIGLLRNMAAIMLPSRINELRKSHFFREGSK